MPIGGEEEARLLRLLLLLLAVASHRRRRRYGAYYMGNIFWRPRRPSRRLRSARCAAQRPLPRAPRRLCLAADAASEDKAAASVASHRTRLLGQWHDQRVHKVGPRWRAPMCGAGRAALMAVLGAQSAREVRPTPRPRARLLPTRSACSALTPTSCLAPQIAQTRSGRLAHPAVRLAARLGDRLLARLAAFRGRHHGRGPGYCLLAQRERRRRRQ